MIIGVDGEDMKGKLLSDVAAKIHGEKGTAVTIRVQRGDEEKEFTMNVQRLRWKAFPPV